MIIAFAYQNALLPVLGGKLKTNNVGLLREGISATRLRRTNVLVRATGDALSSRKIGDKVRGKKKSARPSVSLKRTSYCRRATRRRTFGSSVWRECSLPFAALAVDGGRYAPRLSCPRPTRGAHCGIRCAYAHRTSISDLPRGGSTPSLQ